MVPNVLLDAWATMMWRACWQGSLVVLAVWIICRLLPSMPARFQCWFWRLAAVKFLAVLLLPFALDLPVFPAPAPAANPALPELSPMLVVAMPCSPTDETQASPSRAMELPSLRAILCFVWLIGAIWSVARLLAAWHEATRLRRRGQTLEHMPIAEQLRGQAKLFRLRTTPRLLEVARGGSPMLIGFFRPAIVIPSETLARLNAAEQTMVLGHELAHFCRGDLLWGLAASLVRAVFFFHPLVWFAQRQLQLAQEVAADELVVAHQDHDPISYGKLLVSVVAKLGSELGPRRLVSTISLETAGPVHSLTRRLVAMSCIGRTSRRVLVASGVLLGAVVLLGLAPWRLVAAEPTVGPLPIPRAPDELFQKGSWYEAEIKVIERKKGQPEKLVCTPRFRYLAGNGCMMLRELEDESQAVKVTVLSTPDGKSLEHTVTATVYRDREGKELTREDISTLEKSAVNSLGNDKNSAVVSASRMTLAADKTNGKVTGKITTTTADGSELEVVADIYPVKASTSATTASNNGEQGEPSMTYRTLAKIVPVRVDGELFAIDILENETRVAAFDKRTGESKSLDVAENAKVIEVVVGDNMGACVMHGSPISQLIVYDNKIGKWSTFQLPMRNRPQDASPIVGDHVACYQLKDCIVAYSATKHTWGMLATDATPVVGDYAIMAETAKGQFEFTDQNGAWVAVKSSAATRRL